MLKMPSLYDQNRDAWDALYKAGYRSCAEMAKHFVKCSVMDKALGFENSSARWHRGAGKPSTLAESRAKEWLDAHAHKVVDAAPIAPAAAGGTLLLVACADDVAVKARKVLAILGCEVTEV